MTGVYLCLKVRIVLHPKKRHVGHRIRSHTFFLDFGCFGCRKPSITAHEKDTCDKMRICSNSRYFDFQMDPDRVTGVFLLGNSDCIASEKATRRLEDPGAFEV